MSRGFQWIARAAFAAVLLLSSAAATPAFGQSGAPSPSPSAAIFEVRPFGPLPPPEPSAPSHIMEDLERKPIPLAWLIGGGIVTAIVVLLLIWGAARAARSSNLFDQQYRFPAAGAAALRFGGQKSGGHLARADLPPISAPAATPDEGA